MPVINARLVMGSIAAARWPWKTLREGAGMYHPGAVVYQRPHFERMVRNSVSSCQNPIANTVESRIAVALQLRGYRPEKAGRAKARAARCPKRRGILH